MKPRVYLETTVVSYLTAWSSRDIVIAAHQQVTRDWWKTCRAAGYQPPIICTPEELMEAASDD